MQADVPSERTFSGQFSAQATAVSIGIELTRGDNDFALRVLAMAVARFRHLPPTQHSGGLEKPETTGSTQWDTLLAVVIGLECDNVGIPHPGWTHPPSLDHAWVATSIARPSKRWVERVRSRTPKEFSDLGIWFDPRNLVTS
jgi:hypothetical protein